MIITVANTKGGVGKTTLAVHIATILAEHERTLLVDADPSGVALQWFAWRQSKGLTGDNLEAVQLIDDEVYTKGKEYALEYDNMVIDVGGWDNPGLRLGVVLSDKVIMPMNLSGFDAIHIEKMLEIFAEARQHNEHFQVKVLPSLIDTRTRDESELRELVGEYGLEAFRAPIQTRKAFRATTSTGKVINDLSDEYEAKTSLFRLITELRATWK